MIKRHPILRRVNAVISIPGSDTTVWRPGETVASRTSELVGTPFFRTTAKHRGAARGEGGWRSGRSSKQVRCRLPTGTRLVLIVDDVLKSGATMRAVTLAAQRAGAEFAYGLVCARTMRKQ